MSRPDPPVNASEGPQAPAGAHTESSKGDGRLAARPPGTVAHEAALLLDLLARRAPDPAAGMPAGSGASSHPSRSSASSTPRGPGESGPESGPEPAPDANPEAGYDGRHRPAHDCTCGGQEPAACRVCPVCQVISFVQQVNPETIERIADLVGFAATALHDLATAQRERTDQAGPGESQDDRP